MCGSCGDRVEPSDQDGPGEPIIHPRVKSRSSQTAPRAVGVNDEGLPLATSRVPSSRDGSRVLAVPSATTALRVAGVSHPSSQLTCSSPIWRPAPSTTVGACDDPGPRTCYAAVAGVAGGLAGGPIRGGLQAHPRCRSRWRSSHRRRRPRRFRIGRQPEALNRESRRDTTSGFAEIDHAPPWI